METASNSTDLTQSPIKTKEDNSQKIINLDTDESKDTKDSANPFPSSSPNIITLASEEPKQKGKNNKSKKEKKEFPKPIKKIKFDDTPDKDKSKEKNNVKKEKEKEKEKGKGKEISETLLDNDKDKNKDNSNKGIKDIIIEIGDDKDSPTQKKEKKKKSKKEPKDPKDQETKNRNSVISGYNAFIFYEKEKFKGVNCKEINVREYVSQISSEWRKMSEKDKEPYVKMAIDFKNNNKLPMDEKGQLLTKKRKRKATTKEKKGSNKIKKEKSSDGTKNKKVSTSAKKIKIERKGSESQDKKNNDNNENDNDNDECMNNLIYSVFVPFVEKAYEYFNSKGIIRSKK